MTAAHFCRESRDRIDTVRGIACILLVAYHVVGIDSTSGMRVGDDSYYRAGSDALGYIRMPLFSFLSGIVYAARPVSFDGMGKFVGGKVMRLLIPLICVAPLFAVVQALTPGVNSSIHPSAIPLIFFTPFAHFWFLQALFTIFVCVGLLDAGGMLRTKPRLVAIVALSCALFLARHHVTDLFSLSRALYLLPFFVGGMAMARIDPEADSKTTLRMIAPLTCAVIMACTTEMASWTDGIRLVIGVWSSAMLVKHAPAIPLLSRVGSHSYSIYLHHVFGAAASRIGLKLIGIDSPELVFISGLSAGLAAGIVTHRLFASVPYLSRALLGIRARSRGEKRAVGGAGAVLPSKRPGNDADHAPLARAA